MANQPKPATPAPGDGASQHGRETVFHDQWAASTDVSAILVDDFFEAPTALENRYILASMGSLRGKRLLDIGCGLGESSVYFAKQGARVTALDLSPGMVESAVRLSRFHKVEIEGAVSEGENLKADTGVYDFVYVANTIHHVASKEHLYREISRVLKPGGRFFSWDPLAYNPVINIYRRMATEVRTEDERPLEAGDLKLMAKYFGQIETRTFWILGLSLFLKYYLVDRIDPNKERYWKLIYKKQSLWWWKPLAAIDRLLTRLPGIRYLAWNIVISGRKPGED